jgi:hypothetical protein
MSKLGYGWGEQRKWMLATFGWQIRDKRWISHDQHYCFRDECDMILFKLRWL